MKKKKKKMTKMVSYSERMNSKYGKKGDYSPVMSVRTRENYSDGNRVLKKSVIKEVNNAEVMAAYSPYDFKIENLAAVGALQDAKRYTYDPSTLDMMDSVNGAIDFVDTIMENNDNKEND